jgi:hypothetical protein
MRGNLFVSLQFGFALGPPSRWSERKNSLPFSHRQR